jgi:hypothetical protein
MSATNRRHEPAAVPITHQQRDAVAALPVLDHGAYEDLATVSGTRGGDPSSSRSRIAAAERMRRARARP